MLHERFDLLLLGQHHTSMSDGRYTFDIDVPKALAYHRLIHYGLVTLGIVKTQLIRPEEIK